MEIRENEFIIKDKNDFPVFASRERKKYQRYYRSLKFGLVLAFVISVSNLFYRYSLFEYSLICDICDLFLIVAFVPAIFSTLLYQFFYGRTKSPREDNRWICFFTLVVLSVFVCRLLVFGCLTFFPLTLCHLLWPFLMTFFTLVLLSSTAAINRINTIIPKTLTDLLSSFAPNNPRRYSYHEHERNKRSF
jgi:predicted neutral ceramidase superfamily lipid hydrolase